MPHPRRTTTCTRPLYNLMDMWLQKKRQCIKVLSPLWQHNVFDGLVTLNVPLSSSNYVTGLQVVTTRHPKTYPRKTGLNISRSMSLFAI